MKTIDLSQVINAVRGRLDRQGTITKITGVSTDTRNIKKGDIFFPLTGENFNGHNFVDEACEKGCAVVIVSEPVSVKEGVSVIFVEDTLKALQDLARYYLSLFKIKKIAITGSTGKTTTKELLYALMSSKYKTARNIGNYNNHIGLPLTVFTIEEYHEVAIFEMGMSGISEIDLMAEIVRPDIAIITNIGLSHIEKLGSRKNILKAKLEIANYFSENEKLIINYDNDLLKVFADSETNINIIKVGTSEGCKYRILEIIGREDSGIEFTIDTPEGEYDFALKIMGRHNAYNSSLAIAAANTLGVEMEKCKTALKAFIQTDKRLSITENENNIKIIDDTYNASPDSMKAAIDVLKTVSGRRKLAIFGDMFEMGEFAEKHHREIGEYASKQKLDMVISVGDNAVFIYEAAKVNMPEGKVRHYESKEELEKDLVSFVSPGDVILVKGSRGMKMEKIVEFLQKNRS